MRRGIATRDRQPEPVAPEKPQIIGGDPDCVHHWVIDSPAGSVSMGLCRVCSARRAFSNYVSDFIYEGDSADTLPQAGWKKPVTELVKPDVEGTGESSPGTEGDY
ncbi:MAG TPA: hypothetical protein VM013_06145 [Dehalococcoidia bacterium]|nr:hypothetical protein [Dehalococcoidia bacterium]